MNKRTDLLTLADAKPLNPLANAEDDAMRRPEESEAEFFDRMLGEAPEPKDDAAMFNWVNDDSIIIREQRATAVYENVDGDIVIRQQKSWDQDDDPCMVITADNRHALIRALDSLDDLFRHRNGK